MKKIMIAFFCAFLMNGMYGAQTIENVMINIQETVSTGMPITLMVMVWWVLAHRMADYWPDLSDPAASFIRKTWKDQGFSKADQVVLKEIPLDSIFSKIFTDTQQLPNVLGVGMQFRKKIEKLLIEKNNLLLKMNMSCDSFEIFELKKKLRTVENGLQHCRFVCGHERVHTEEGHMFRIVMIQCLAPFVIHSLLKYITSLVERYEIDPRYSTVLRKNITRSLLEMGTLWCAAHWYERKANLNASHHLDGVDGGICLLDTVDEHT